VLDSNGAVVRMLVNMRGNPGGAGTLRDACGRSRVTRWESLVAEGAVRQVGCITATCVAGRADEAQAAGRDRQPPTNGALDTPRLLFAGSMGL
jgi:hypothetical protein